MTRMPTQHSAAQRYRNKDSKMKKANHIDAPGRATLAAPLMGESAGPRTGQVGDLAESIVDATVVAGASRGMRSDGPSSDGPSSEAGPRQGAFRKIAQSLVWVSRLAESESPLDAVLSAQGHDHRCRMRVRAGLEVTCACRTRQPAEDAAIAIGLAMRFARFSHSRSVPLPHGIVEQLRRHVNEGNAAAAVVWDWLERQDLVPARGMAKSEDRPRLRLVCKEEK